MLVYKLGHIDRQPSPAKRHSIEYESYYDDENEEESIFGPVEWSREGVVRMIKNPTVVLALTAVILFLIFLFIFLVCFFVSNSGGPSPQGPALKREHIKSPVEKAPVNIDITAVTSTPTSANTEVVSEVYTVSVESKEATLELSIKPLEVSQWHPVKFWNSLGLAPKIMIIAVPTLLLLGIASAIMLYNHLSMDQQLFPAQAQDDGIEMLGHTVLKTENLTVK